MATATGSGEPSGRGRPHWTVYAALFLTAVLVVLGLVPYLSRASVSWYEAGVGVLVVGAVVELLLAAGVLRHRWEAASSVRAHPVQDAPPVVSNELLNRWKTMRDRVWVAFTTRDRSASMLVSEDRILSLLTGERNAGRLSESERACLDRAFTARGAYGWLVAHTALAWALGLLENQAQHDRSAFNTAREIIQTVASEGRNAADAWVELARQAGASRLGDQVRDEWARFRDPANLMLNDLNSLVLDTYREAGSNVPFRTELIREI